ncbi:DUF4386 domain-containing protein [Aliiroseovarius sp. S1339]|uniref:DUF4386 domain-containing protein n=1 Tax=Aliiroseovarius sp. S1339 TaxID=2936990 RepID=UPI0020BD7BE2|nr:DUF4386 domain-containing protein [Aliiroseovarius sp. S1339]MCK8462418.1 DUF4386 domain-containing protein [Aliiroseovarius sp. S1339]
MNVQTNNSHLSSSDRASQRAARIAGVLFITATASTMAAQLILEPLLEGSTPTGAPQPQLVALATLLELVNALASAGIAIALYPVLRGCAEIAAAGYLGLRVVEGAVGVVAAAALAVIVSTSANNWVFAIALHDTAFLMALLVFSCGTLLLYPMLFFFRLVPRVLSLWGLIGGPMLLVSCVLILFDRIEMGGTADLIMSLPIWINEMALALWLLIRGLDLTHAGSGDRHAA